jgi:hypothetical protein
VDRSLVFTDPDSPNWFFDEFYVAGVNTRYYTFQLALNLLNQFTPAPTIIETGSQRLENDLGDGRSTTIFCEYISRYGGRLISVDSSRDNLVAAERWTQAYEIDKEFVHSDSIEFLKLYEGSVDLIYLDSWDYPVDNGADVGVRRLEAQQHNLNELLAIEGRLNPSTLVLLDDNQLPGGGKPRLTKQYLAQNGYACLLDFQQSLWTRRIGR